jgi:Kelch motif protein
MGKGVGALLLVCLIILIATTNGLTQGGRRIPQVLIAGGISDGPNPEPGPLVPLATAELYNPVTGTYAPTKGDMSLALAFASATRLRDGRVLIAGGTDMGFQGGASFANAQIYNPSTQAFSPTGNLVTGRSGHIAVLLKNGKVLIAGGFNLCCGGLASAELYDPKTGTFTATGNMTQPRNQAMASMLSNGQVLVVGGLNDIGFPIDYPDMFAPLATAEIYDPRSGAFHAIANMIAARADGSATLLRNGKVLLAGGGALLPPPRRGAAVGGSTELYDPKTGAFSPTGSMITGRFDLNATVLKTGSVLITGGTTVGLGGRLVNAAPPEVYNAKNGVFGTAASLTGDQGTGHQGAAIALDSGDVLIGGGVAFTQGGFFPLAASELYHSQSNSFTATQSMGTTRWGAAATAVMGR